MISSEGEVVRQIFDNRQFWANTIDFALISAFSSSSEHPFGQDIYCGFNIDRALLGLDPQKKPGDVDVLIIPFKDRLLLEKTIAIETKIVRPTLKKPGRNANSMGVAQAKGLLRDGFPFVGLLHICLPEALPQAFHLSIPMMSLQLEPNGHLKPTGKNFTFDPFPSVSAERQLGRLNSLQLPHEICYKAIALETFMSSDEILGCSIGNYRFGKPNPSRSVNLLNNIQNFFNKNVDRFRFLSWSAS